MSNYCMHMHVYNVACMYATCKFLNVVYLTGCLREKPIEFWDSVVRGFKSRPRELSVLFTVLVLMCEFCFAFLFSLMCGYMYV